MVNPFKNNFWPRPRDEASDFLLTSVIQFTPAAMITAMAVYNNRLYYAVAYRNALPRLFSWDGQNAPVEVAVPAWNNAPATTFRIQVMAVYNNQLWIATSPNGVAAPNQVIEIWFFNGTAWTDGKTLAGWAAAPLNPCESIANAGRGAGWMFVFNNIIFVGQDTAAAGVGIEVQGWNGTTWLGAVEVVGVGGAGAAAGNSTEPTSRMHAPIRNNVVYAGAYDDRNAGGGGSGDAEVYTRDVAGTWTRLYTFPNTGGNIPTDPVETVVQLNGEIYAAHGAVLGAGSGDPFQLASVTTNPITTRVDGLGFRSGIAVGSEIAGGEVALLASPNKLWVFDPTNWNLEYVAEYYDDAPMDIVEFDNKLFLSQGSEVLMGLGGVTHSSRISRID